MSLGELSEHPDWPRLLDAVQNMVDKARADVVVASAREPIEVVRYRAGKYDALAQLHRDLKGGNM